MADVNCTPESPTTPMRKPGPTQDLSTAKRFTGYPPQPRLQRKDECRVRWPRSCASSSNRTTEFLPKLSCHITESRNHQGSPISLESPLQRWKVGKIRSTGILGAMSVVCLALVLGAISVSQCLSIPATYVAQSPSPFHILQAVRSPEPQWTIYPED